MPLLLQQIVKKEKVCECGIHILVVWMIEIGMSCVVF